MSMDFSEFLRRLGAEPRSRDPELLRTGDSAPEFREAAAAAARFEDLLERAAELPLPPGLVDELRSLADQPTAPPGLGWRRMALAAGMLIAVGAALLVWQSGQRWDSVEDYVAGHYRHDGAAALALAGGPDGAELQRLLGEFRMAATPELAGIVSVVKNCPTPDGKGVHLVLNTTQGLVTVLYMPGTAVTDHEFLAFDDRQAVLVSLPRGSAAVIGSGEQQMEELYALLRRSLVTTAEPG
jgi:hypothetical protein